MIAVEQDALLALAGLLVLFGGIFPLLRRIAASPAASHKFRNAVPMQFAAGNGATVRPEPILSPSEQPDALGVDAETLRTLVANDPARTAQVIKEWIARDRNAIKRAS
jgi:flagellar biosynthesis/type III secretory pathway M-ring protein FliF/YscJ